MRLTSEQTRALFEYMDDIDVVYINQCDNNIHTEFCATFTTSHKGTSHHLAPTGEITNE